MPTKKLGEVAFNLIGDDFEPGAQGNADIDYLLGHDTIHFDGQAVRSEKYGCLEAPDYCNDAEIVLAELKKIGIDPIILPARSNTDDNQRKTFVAVFQSDGETYLTRPFATDTLALACVLWYVFFYLKQ
ncbi:hypothetical protein [Acinetobacter brisouii]|uniref:hypothetical protein n=1 Tax=Acinetobacter brisouii TaxID=396323 RepID=UPI00124EB1F0|nr:hypothetical protein [Acinetobacter brisouii]